MNNNEEYNNKMSPLYFHTHNIIKKYFEVNDIKFNLNKSNNIELFTLEDYKSLNDNLSDMLKGIDTITIDTIEFFGNKNIVLRLPHDEEFNIFCNLSFIDEIKDIVKNILK